jgi:hypothetical protein
VFQYIRTLVRFYAAVVQHRRIYCASLAHGLQQPCERARICMFYDGMRRPALPPAYLRTGLSAGCSSIQSAAHAELSNVLFCALRFNVASWIIPACGCSAVFWKISSDNLQYVQPFHSTETVHECLVSAPSCSSIDISFKLQASYSMCSHCHSRWLGLRDNGGNASTAQYLSMTPRTGQHIHLFARTPHTCQDQRGLYPSSDMDLSNSHAAVQNKQIDRFATEALNFARI